MITRALYVVVATAVLCSAQDKPSIQKVEQKQDQAADQNAAAFKRAQDELRQARAELAAQSIKTRSEAHQMAEDKRVADALAADALTRHLKDIDDKLAAAEELKKEALVEAKASSDRNQKWWMGILAAILLLMIGGVARWVSTHFQLKRVERSNERVERQTDGMNARITKVSEDRLEEARRAEKELAFRQGTDVAHAEDKS